MNLSKLKRFSTKGFTLIELLIVIAILGVLAAAVLVAINPGQRIAAARNSRVKADLVALGSEANIFNTDTGLDSACTTPGYPIAFGGTCGAVTYRAASPATPAGGVYVIAGTTTAIGITGPAYADGVVPTGQEWCWRSATGQTIYQATATTCP